MNAESKNIDNKKIRSEINGLKKSLLNYRFQKSTGQLEKTSEIKKIRKKIARLKTEINKAYGGTDA
jgi:large subunit ribosomal protein L29